MKKINAYTIQDEIFMDALEIIQEHFNEIPYAIVDGGAVQIYATFATIKDTGINSVNKLNGLSLVLRKTGDIDLSFDSSPASIIKILNIIMEQTHYTYSFHNFTKRFVLQDGPKRLNLNYQLEPEDLKGISSYYKHIIKTAIPIDLPYKNKEIYIKIAKPEYLITSKLTRANPKDQADIALLLKSMEIVDYPFDSEEVRSILKSVNKGDQYHILSELMDSI